jgi:hypothetical protein
MARRRRFYYENVFGVDQYSMKVLRALHAKYTRDYLSFFKSLSSMYGASPQKKEIDSALNLVQKVRGTIESILQNQTIGRDDAKVLYELTGQIEEKKDALMEQAAQVKALRAKLDKVQQEIGISAKDLNVTRQIVRKGVKQAIGSQREGVMDFLSRTAPGTLELGRRLARGTAETLAGPFAPILGMGYDVAKGAVGVAGGVRKKLMERQERKFASKLKAYSPTGDLENVVQARRAGASLADIAGTVGRGVSQTPQIKDRTGRGRADVSLMEFWNKGAYRAKYTKELLSVLKDIRGKGRGRLGDLRTGLADVADDFVLLGAAMGPLIAKGAGFALLAVGVGNAIVQFGRLHNAVNDWLGAKKQEKEALAASEKSYQNWIKVIEKQGIEEVAKQAHMSVRGMAEHLAKEKMRIDLEHRRLRSGVKGFVEELKDVVMGPNVGPSLVERSNEIIRIGGGDPATYTLAAEMKKLNDKVSEQNDLMKRANENMARREKEANEKYPVTGTMFPPNVHDSGDVLLNEHANGNLRFGE